MPEHLCREVLSIFSDYESLLKTASRDREAILGFVDNLNARLDDLPEDPTAAREVAAHIARRERRD